MFKKGSCRSGISKVNAAVYTQILIDVFSADVIVNTGIAGSLKNEINIGDIVISTEVPYYDVDAGGNQRVYGTDTGVLYN